MDRCRCVDYEAAVKKLRFFTVGTLRPDIVDNFDGTGYQVSWFKQGVSYDDMKFTKPKARKDLKEHELPQNLISKDAWKIEQMWCPFMTPFKVVTPEEEK